jgi:hypothetical protein
MQTLGRLHSNSSWKEPLFHLEYEVETLDVLFAFEMRLAAELEDRGVLYETVISIGLHTYHLTYYVYATP